MCVAVVRIVYPVSSDCQPCSIGLICSFSIVTHNSAVGAVIEAFLGDLIFINEKHGVASFDAAFRSLGQSSNFIAI